MGKFSSGSRVFGGLAGIFCHRMAFGEKIECRFVFGGPWLSIGIVSAQELPVSASDWMQVSKLRLDLQFHERHGSHRIATAAAA